MKNRTILLLDWSEYQVSDGTGLIKVNPEVSPLSVYQRNPYSDGTTFARLFTR